MVEIKQCSNKFRYRQHLGYAWCCFTTSLNTDTRITYDSVALGRSFKAVTCNWWNVVPLL